jgi:hypothetical protein
MKSSGTSPWCRILEICTGLNRLPDLAISRKRPHVAIPRETNHFHLAVRSRTRSFGDLARTGIRRQNSRDRIRQPKDIARVVANATRRFGRETLAPDGRIERVAELRLEGQRDHRGRGFAAELSLTHPVLRCRSLNSEICQTAAPDQCSVFLPQNRETAERKLLITCECGP